MYKVLIIDDEPVVRKGIINVIGWEGFGCRIVGEAANGIEGKNLILEHRPDIILTDIYMPEMNGLDMIRETLSAVPKAQIIVLTGYRNFDYIQEALRLGAADYLLKPTKLGAIQNCIHKAVQTLDERKQTSEEIVKLEKLFNEARPILLEKRLRDAIFHVSPTDDAFMKDMELFDFHLSDYYLLLAEIADVTEAYNLQLSKLGIRNAFVETFGSQLQVTPIDIGNKRILFIMQASDGHEDLLDVDRIMEGIENFMEMVKDVFDIEFDGALSTHGTKISELYQKASECMKTIEYKHYLGDGAILLAQDFLTEKYDDIGLIAMYQEPFLQAVKVGNVDAVHDILEKIKVSYEETYCFKAFDIQDFIVRLTYDVLNYVLIHSDLELAAFKMDAMKIQKALTQSRGVEAVFELLSIWSADVAKNRHAAQTENIDSLVLKAKKYMEMHYSENISLKEVAEYVNISTYYLSRLFKKETGRNFSEHLTDFRMEKAKSFLTDTDMKLYEIAIQVGISDPHYFSRLFKKNVGVPPTQFREKEIE